MLCGKPVVSAALATGVPWVNQHERTGLVVPPGDVAELRRALVRLLSDAELRHGLGQRARARVLDQFTAEAMCCGTVALYETVAARSACTARAEVAGVV
jgi:rhamnosyl/mannosyltransferase